MPEIWADAFAENVICEVDQAYWLVVSLKSKERLAESYLDLVTKLDDDVKKMLKQGVATNATLLSVDVKVNEANVALTKVRNGLVLARMALAQLCGEPIDEPMILADELRDDLDVSLQPSTIDMAQSGRDLSWGYNGYNFLWKPMKGNFTLVAKIDCLPPTGDRWYGRKAGLMVRSSLDATANMRAYGIKRTGDYLIVDGRHKTTETGQAVREHVKVDGAPISSFSASTSTSAWVRLRRRGTVFTAEYKIAQSDNWALEYEYEDTNSEYGETTYVGLTAWGEGDGTYTTVPCYLWRFSDIRLRTLQGMVISIQ